jgi:adenylate kinase
MWTGELIPLLGEGHNFLPMIHVKDLAKIVKKVMTDRPAQQYLLAVDKGKEPLKDIIAAMACGNKDKIANVEILDVYTEEWSDYFGMNMSMRPSTLCEHDFQWHAKEGIVKNLDKV